MVEDIIRGQNVSEYRIKGVMKLVKHALESDDWVLSPSNTEDLLELAARVVGTCRAEANFSSLLPVEQLASGDVYIRELEEEISRWKAITPGNNTYMIERDIVEGSPFHNWFTRWDVDQHEFLHLGPRNQEGVYQRRQDVLEDWLDLRFYRSSSQAADVVENDSDDGDVILGSQIIDMVTGNSVHRSEMILAETLCEDTEGYPVVFVKGRVPRWGTELEIVKLRIKTTTLAWAVRQLASVGAIGRVKAHGIGWYGSISSVTQITGRKPSRGIGLDAPISES